MKQTILIPIVWLWAVLPAIAQHEEPVLLKVSYQFIYVNDTNNRSNPINTVMVLHIGQTNSKYNNSSFEGIAAANTQGPVRPAGHVVVVSGKPMAVVTNEGNDVLFQQPKEKKLIKTASVGMSDYVIESPLTSIDWQVKDDVKNIAGYSCQKAIGFFRGRVYTAWFTTALPFPEGPWKLWGLPGLILEAKDSTGEVIFLCKEVTKGEPGQRIASYQLRPAKVSSETFDRAKKEFDRDPSTIMQSQAHGYSDPIPVFYRDAAGNTLSGDEALAAIKNEKKIYNNPIERAGR